MYVCTYIHKTIRAYNHTYRTPKGVGRRCKKEPRRAQESPGEPRRAQEIPGEPNIQNAFGNGSGSRAALATDQAATTDWFLVADQAATTDWSLVADQEATTDWFLVADQAATTDWSLDARPSSSH